MGGLETPVLFPETQNHLDVARAMLADPISAGFWRVEAVDDYQIKYHAYGESYTLNMKSREVDSDILNQWFNSTTDMRHI